MDFCFTCDLYGRLEPTTYDKAKKKASRRDAFFFGCRSQER